MIKFLRRLFCRHIFRDIRIDLMMSDNWVDSYWTVSECTKCKKLHYEHSHYNLK